VEDKYVWFVLGQGMDSEYFWNTPIANVERTFESAIAFKGWSNNPSTL
jgi:hypothetical protein